MKHQKINLLVDKLLRDQVASFKNILNSNWTRFSEITACKQPARWSINTTCLFVHLHASLTSQTLLGKQEFMYAVLIFIINRWWWL